MTFLPAIAGYSLTVFSDRRLSQRLRRLQLFHSGKQDPGFHVEHLRAHYVEIAKVRAYGSGFPRKEIISARYALHQCLKSILLLLAPICPFITEALWLKIYSTQSIHSQTFPDPKNWDKQYMSFENQIVDFNSKVWNEKKSRGLSLKESIHVEIPAELQQFASDLKAMHNISSG